MKICDSCKKLIEDNDKLYKYSYIGEYGDSGVYQKEVRLCSCGGNFVDAIQCEECGSYFSSEKCMHENHPICGDCFEKIANADSALEYAEYDGFGKDEVKINSFVAYCLGENEINEILKNEIRKNPDVFKEKAKEFCLDDPFFFSEFLIHKERGEKA